MKRSRVIFYILLTLADSDMGKFRTVKDSTAGQRKKERKKTEAAGARAAWGRGREARTHLRTADARAGSDI